MHYIFKLFSSQSLHDQQIIVSMPAMYTQQLATSTSTSTSTSYMIITISASYDAMTVRRLRRLRTTEDYEMMIQPACYYLLQQLWLYIYRLQPVSTIRSSYLSYCSYSICSLQPVQLLLLPLVYMLIATYQTCPEASQKRKCTNTNSTSTSKHSSLQQIVAQ